MSIQGNTVNDKKSSCNKAFELQLKPKETKHANVKCGCSYRNVTPAN